MITAMTATLKHLMSQLLLHELWMARAHGSDPAYDRDARWVSDVRKDATACR